MSFKATYKTKIKEVNHEFLQEAVEMMARSLELKLKNIREFSIYDDRVINVNGLCFKDKRASYPVNLCINKKDELEIQCDTADQNVYKEYMKRVQEQFYPAVVVSHRTGSPVKYDKETEKLTLMITR